MPTDAHKESLNTPFQARLLALLAARSRELQLLGQPGAQPSVRALVVRLCEDLIDRGYVTSLEVAATHVGSQRFGSPRCRTAFRECLKSAFV